MDDLQLREALHTIAQQEIQDDMNLWPNIQSQLNQPVRRARPAFRLLKVAAVIAILILASAVTYAFYQELVGDPGMEAVNQDNLVTYFDETQTLESKYNFDVTLDYAYADANRITVAYHSTGAAPASQGMMMYANSTLTDASGRRFERIGLGGGGGGGGGSSDPDEIIQVGSSELAVFDSSVIEGTPSELSLTLTVEIAYSNIDTMGEPGTAPGMIFAGQVVFNFTVPFNPGRVMDTQQSVTASGVDMTLRKVVVAPSLTRVEICYDDPASAGQSSQPFGLVEVNGEVVVPEIAFPLSYTPPEQAVDNCHALNIPEALQNVDGEWTVTITALRVPGTEDLEAVAEALREEYGVDVEVAPEGGLRYNSPEDKLYADFADIVDDLIRQSQQSVDGPWVFSFTLD